MAVLQLQVNCDDADSTFRVTLDGVPYRLRLVWNDLQYAAFLYLYRDDGTPLVMHRRLSPGYVTLMSPLAVPGLFYVDGDPNRVYNREDVGGAIRLFYVEADTTLGDALL